MKEVVPQARKSQFELRLAKECKAFVCRDLSRLSRPFAIADDSLIRVHSSSDSSLPVRVAVIAVLHGATQASRNRCS